MKCISINEINKFHYHDAYVNSVKIINSDMIWETSLICINSDNSQNHENYDTETDDMKLIFKDFVIDRIIEYGYESRSYDGEIIAKKDNVNLQPSQFKTIINDMISSTRVELKYGGYNDDNVFCFDVFIDNELYNISIKFNEFIAEWEYTKDAAWYLGKGEKYR